MDDSFNSTKRQTKKVKLSQVPSSSVVWTETILDTVWQHYRNYADNDDGEMDELVELLEILDHHQQQYKEPTKHTILTDVDDTTKTSESRKNGGGGTSDTTDRLHTISFQSRTQLVPWLISVAHCVLAEDKIAALLQQQQQHQQRNNGVGVVSTTRTDLHQQICTHLTQSLSIYPQNATAWSMAANFTRSTMTNLTTIPPSPPKAEAAAVTNKSTTDATVPTTTTADDAAAAAATVKTITCKIPTTTTNTHTLLLTLYARAANHAASIRKQGITLLNDPNVPKECKEWIEMLLLNQMAGVELVSDEEDEERNDFNKNDDDNDNNSNPEEFWSASSVESTTRFMAIMLASMAGDHETIALQQLEYFPSLTHRLHPKVWYANHQYQCGTSSEPNFDSESNQNPESSCLDKGIQPLVFRSTAGILPTTLYERLCQIFHPDADYWIESDYINRGYYSYFMNIPENYKPGDDKFTPSNLIEDVVCNYLLPIVQQQRAHTDPPIVGYEWWIHTREVSANLGHNLHFDTDEALLSQEKVITHPEISSVLYLTGGSSSGATIVLNQTPDSTENATMAYISRPVNNSFMTFPGNLLHGVLPCPGQSVPNCSNMQIFSELSDKQLLSTLFQFWKDPMSTLSTYTDAKQPAILHRLTLMVGFWTRNVPDQMQERKLYGPCGPIPPMKDATWVKDISDGYKEDRNTTRVNQQKPTLHCVPGSSLPYVCPAWQEINSGSGSTTATTSKFVEKKEHDDVDSPELEIPKAIDHRFFVTNAPMCFRESLFEEDECDHEDYDASENQLEEDEQ